MGNPRKVIDIRGHPFGGDTPLICSPLVARTPERLIEEAGNVLAKGPDVIEWRVDFYEPIARTKAVVDALHKLRALAGSTPIIFTRRSHKEGGQPVPLDEAGVIDLYGTVAATGLVDFLDFEMEHDGAQVRRVRELASTHGTRVILSYHNFLGTPPLESLLERFEEAERQTADVAKVAVMPRDRDDVLTLLRATALADAKLGIPLISMAMGELGAVTRMVGGLFGSALSFAIGEGSSAPGQFPIADLKAVFDVLRRARGG